MNKNFILLLLNVFIASSRAEKLYDITCDTTIKPVVLQCGVGRSNTGIFNVGTYKKSDNKRVIVAPAGYGPIWLWQETQGAWEYVTALEGEVPPIRSPVKLIKPTKSNRPLVATSELLNSNWLSNTGNFTVWEGLDNNKWRATSVVNIPDFGVISDIDGFISPNSNLTVVIYGINPYGPDSVTVMEKEDQEWKATWKFNTTETAPFHIFKNSNQEQHIVLTEYYKPECVILKNQQNQVWKHVGSFESGALSKSNIITFSYAELNNTPTLFVGTYSGTIVIAQESNNQWDSVENLAAHNSTVTGVYGFENSKQTFMISGSWDSTIKIWKQQHSSWQVIKIICMPEGVATIRSLDYYMNDQDELVIISGHSDNSVRVWTVGKLS